MITNPIAQMRRSPTTLVDLLRMRALEQPNRHVYSFLQQGEAEAQTLTYAELDDRARSIAVALQAVAGPGERALLLYPPGLDYIAAFFGCLYAGLIAVPAYPPQNNRALPRLKAIVTDAQASLALTSPEACTTLAERFREVPELNGLRWVTTDSSADCDPELWQDRKIDPGSIAFLQYTSGSTSTPRGVMLSHSNLLHNLDLIQACFEHTPESRGVIWLPPYHDMGLIGGILQPLYADFPVQLMAPVAFLQQPLRWLQAISRSRGTTSGGPNFAYELCVRKITPEQRATLDLSSWDLAFTGAEPVRAETLARFAEAFKPCGFRPEAFYPCYGLAEATLIVSGGWKASRPITVDFDDDALERHHALPVSKPGHNRTLVGSGHIRASQQIVIVHPETRVRCTPDEVGEIWVAGPSVGLGYWNRPVETEQTFHATVADEEPAETFLRTGDLGVLHDGELFVTGRLKDLIIIRGRNHYPQDIELTVEHSHPALRVGSGAAFSVHEDGEERLVVVQEVEREHRRTPIDELVGAIRKAVAEQHELQVYAVVLLKPGGIPKTSSGKIQRRACRDAFLNNQLDILGSDMLAEAPIEQPIVELSREDLLAAELVERRALLQAYLRSQIARRIGIEAGHVDLDQPATTLGIDSLMAVELQHTLEIQLGLVVPMVYFLEDRTLADLVTDLLERLDSSTTSAGTLRFAASDEHTEQPLSHGQRALWFLHQLAPHSSAYHIASAVKICSAIDLAALARAFQILVDRHAMLRTTFSAHQGEPFQRIRPQQQLHFHIADAASWNDSELSARLAETAQRPFDLEHGPLLRIDVFTRGAHESILLLVVHHSVADLWSLSVLTYEFGRLYPALQAGRPIDLPRLTFEYTDYVRRQQAMLAGPEGERLAEYWQQQLAGAPTALDLPIDHPRPSIQTYRGAAHGFTLPPELTRQLKQVAQSHNTTLFTTLLAAWQVLLSRYTGQTDLLVGSSTSGRGHADLANIIGYLVNPLVLRANLANNPTFATFLAQMRQTVLSAFKHQEYPFPLLVERLQPDRDARRSPLFQVMFVMQQTQRATDTGVTALALGTTGVQLNVGGVQLESVALEQPVAQFDVTLMMAETADGLAGTWQYNADLFDESTIARMAGQFATLLSSIVANPNQRIGTLELLPAAERHQLLVAWNATADFYPSHLCIHQLFEAQAARTPDLTALVVDGQQLTYHDLNQRANQVAHYLHRVGVRPGVRVGLCFQPSIEVIVGLLGVLKAGGCYVPLDPSYPTERLGFMLDDAHLLVLLTHTGLATELPEDRTRVIYLDRDWATIAQEPSDNLINLVTPDHLAYTIYTSGSTGQPKGASVYQRGVVNLLHWFTGEFGISAQDRALVITSLSFDLTQKDLFAPLIMGGQLHLFAAKHYDVELITQQIAAHNITLLNCTPSAFYPLADHDGTPARHRLASLRYVFLGGEPIAVARLETWAASAGSNTQLVNTYGPTECTDTVSFYRVEHLERFRDAPIPIGYPIANTQLYILDRSLNPVPIGVIGELYISGDGVGRGYLNRPELTAEKFVPHPFSSGETGARLYRTGDLTRYRADGTIDFLGRIDHQVKLRGFRIELGEIEGVLSEHPAVGEVVVVAREDIPGDTRLVAYVVENKEQQHQEQREDGSSFFVLRSSLREFLAQRVPDYMVPSAFVVLQALPLTPNGKVDRRALPAPDMTALEREAAFVGPRTLVEERLSVLWSEILGVEQPGIYDNFFRLGGHSLLAMRLIAHIRESFQVDISLTRVFERGTIAALAEEIALSSAAVATLPPITRRSPTEPLVLSFPQLRLWFLDQLDPGSPLYNMPGAIQVTGPLNVAVLERSINMLVQRHEILRTTFTTIDDQPVQVIAPHRYIELHQITLADVPIQQRAAHIQQLAVAEAQRSFDLTQGPLLRITILGFDAENHVLLFTMHHIISDGWSMEVLVQELGLVYEALVVGNPPLLAELPVQYADFAQWQRNWLTPEAPGQVLETQLAYWQQRLANLPVTDLPTDQPRPAVQTFHGATASLPLPHALADALKHLSQQADVTLFMTLLAAFQTLLFRYTGQPDVVIGTDVANRRHLETQSLIGFFVNLLVIRSDLSGNPSFRELLARVRHVTLEAYAHQDLPFELLVEQLQPERDLSRTPLFQIGFAFQEGIDRHLAWKDLSLKPLVLDNGTSKYDLALFIFDTGNDLTASMEYSTDLFAPDTIQRLLQHFEILLTAVVADPDQSIRALPLLSQAEWQRMLVDWNQHQAAYHSDRCIHHLFEDRAAQHPDAVAAVFQDQQITYGELNERANQLAHYLQSLGVRPEVCIGVCMERSLELIIGILAVLKAGAAYVPLDAEYTLERLAFMLQDAQIPILLTQQRLIADLPSHAATVICIDSDWPLIAPFSRSNLHSSVVADNLAYIIYTSGSLGKPKGVMVSHRSFVNAYKAWEQEYQLHTHATAHLQMASCSFDVFSGDFARALCSGARLVLCPKELLLEPADLYRLMRQTGVDAAEFVPAVLRGLVQYVANTGQRLDFMQLLVAGSDVWYVHEYQQIQSLVGPQTRVINSYGVTEATIDSLYFAASTADLPRERQVPIGRPFPNTSTYILESDLQVVPIGVVGELYLSGAGLSRGYLRRAELTAAAFIPHPYSSTAGARLYKTGDLARYHADGTIELLGRSDYQVKIRGYRIELGEIEALLQQHPSIAEAVVMARSVTPSDQRLVAYLVQDTLGETVEHTAESTLSGTQLQQWSAVFDDLYSEQNPTEYEPQFNLAGWNSSYTNQPFTGEEVREWAQHTAGRILELQPRQVLELGCGSGLVLFRVAPHCDTYHAADQSLAPLRYVQHQLSLMQNKPPVILHHRAADDFTDVHENSLDAVVVASVIQYFPHIDYLVQVLEAATQAVKPGGFIFIGDVRSLPLLEAFHASVQVHHAPAAESWEAITGKVHKQLFEEKQLVIDPAFFHALAQRLSKISYAEVQLKRGHFQNELTRFRYDVVLHVGEPIGAAARTAGLDWQKEQLTLASVRQLLVEDAPEMMVVEDVPNARLTKDLHILDWLKHGDKLTSVSTIQAAFENAHDPGVDPEAFWQLSSDLPYRVDITWANSGANGAYTVILSKQTLQGQQQRDQFLSAIGRSQPRLAAWEHYANNPLQAIASHKLAPQLQEYLRESLPSYMIPSAFVFLYEMPLTPNGKLDRNALPMPDAGRSDQDRAFVAPRTKEEQLLADIWSELLGINRIGIHDNFFELGGHSLLATQVIARVRTTFSLVLPLRSLFEAPTIADFADIVAQRRPEYTEPEQSTIAKLDRGHEADLLASLDQLSDDEVRALLNDLLTTKEGPHE